MHIDGELGLLRLTPWEQLFSEKWISSYIDEEDFRLSSAISEIDPSLSAAEVGQRVLAHFERAVVDRLADIFHLGKGGDAKRTPQEQVDYLHSRDPLDSSYIGIWLTPAGEQLSADIDASLDTALAKLGRKDLWRALDTVPSQATLGWSPSDVIDATLCAEDLQAALDVTARGSTRGVVRIPREIGTERLAAFDPTGQAWARFDDEFARTLESTSDQERLAAALAHCQASGPHSAELWHAVLDGTRSGRFVDDVPNHDIRGLLLAALQELLRQTAASPNWLPGVTPVAIDELFLTWASQQAPVEDKRSRGLSMRRSRRPKIRVPSDALKPAPPMSGPVRW